MYGSRSSKDAPSTVMYRPFDSWAANSDWQVSLPPGEEATAVAAGHSFSAVATSQHTLRLFSPAGIARILVHKLSQEGVWTASSLPLQSCQLVTHACCISQLGSITALRGLQLHSMRQDTMC